jgi:hypothetical protein
MGIRHPHEPGPKFPLLSAFGEELEDGLTDSHRQVFAVGFLGAPVRPEARAPEGLVSPPVLEPEEPTRDWLSPLAPQYRVVRRVEAWLDVVSRWLDVRTANEEVGDALERIHELAAARAPAWVLYAMAGVSAFWALHHSVQEAVRRGVGKLRELLFRSRKG